MLCVEHRHNLSRPVPLRVGDLEVGQEVAHRVAVADEGLPRREDAKGAR